MSWKRGRGRLGLLAPLIGTWYAQSESPLGPVSCTRTFESVLGKNYIRLAADWRFGERLYQELALIGIVSGGSIGFWSFTSDGKRSEGSLVEAPDIHPLSIAFEAHMPAGIARMAYWPDETEGIHWVVESKTKKGWNRFTHHHYHRHEAAGSS